MCLSSAVAVHQRCVDRQRECEISAEGRASHWRRPNRCIRLGSASDGSHLQTLLVTRKWSETKYLANDMKDGGTDGAFVTYSRAAELDTETRRVCRPSAGSNLI